MQFFVEKKHNLTLKALILFFHCNNMHVLHMQLKFEQKYVLLYINIAIYETSSSSRYSDIEPLHNRVEVRYHNTLTCEDDET